MTNIISEIIFVVVVHLNSVNICLLHKESMYSKYCSSSASSVGPTMYFTVQFQRLRKENSLKKNHKNSCIITENLKPFSIVICNS